MQKLIDFVRNRKEIHTRKIQLLETEVFAHQKTLGELSTIESRLLDEKSIQEKKHQAEVTPDVSV